MWRIIFQVQLNGNWLAQIDMKHTCKHCGTPYSPGQGTGAFCCSGCEQVYRLIHDEGFDEYYDLQDRVGRPLRAEPFAHRDLSWAAGLQSAAEADGVAPELRLRVGGMSCLGCVWLIERLGKRAPGVRSAQVSLARQCLRLSWTPGLFDLTALIGELQRFGYHADPFAESSAPPVSPLAWRTILCAIFAANSLLLAIPQLLGLDGFVYADLFFLLSLLFVVLSFSVGGAAFIISAWRAVRMPRLGYDVLAGAIVVGVLLLAVLVPMFQPGMEVRAWIFSASVFLLLLGQWLQVSFLQRRSAEEDS